MFDIGSVSNGLDNKCRVIPVARHVNKYLLVFKENLSSHAQRIAACTESLPDVVAERTVAQKIKSGELTLSSVKGEYISGVGSGSGNSSGWGDEPVVNP